MAWMQTIDGNKVSLTEPRKEDIVFSEVAHALSHLCRYAGHTKVFYSVAQHCCLVASLVPLELRLYGLLHDAHEAYIGDITTPVKEALGSAADMALRTIESKLQKAIHEAAGLVWPPHPTVLGVVKYADLVALQTERRDLLAPPPQSWGRDLHLIQPNRNAIVPWTSTDSERIFRREFNNMAAA